MSNNDFLYDDYSEELIEIWIDDFKESGKSLDEEIDNIKGTISNERIWQKGSDTQEQIDMHEQNIVDLEVYLEWLEDEKIKAKEIIE